MKTTPLPPVQVAALVDLALVIDAHFSDGALGDPGKLYATAALNRIFPGQIHTVEKCQAEISDCGTEGCGECPSQALVDGADAKLTVWLEGRDRPRFILPGDAGTLAVLAEALMERAEQIRIGWTPEHDDRHAKGELAAAGAHYAIAASMAALLGCAAWPAVGGPIAKMPRVWPWDRTWWKPGPVRRMLIKAIALLVAEVERIDRADARQVADTTTPHNSEAVKL